jgi:ribonuclease BN (tRNA processing enzyme)
MTPEEAGRHAREAGAGRVVLTHISDELGEEWAREEAELAFGGPVEIAREGATYEV